MCFWVWRQVSRHSPNNPATNICRHLDPSIRTHSARSVITITHINSQSSAAAMVVALGPGKFYGSSLPRPRFYTDVKLNDERVDPPLPVMDPLMAWAQEAHWSMGGLSFKRHRLQGRIEGKVEKLRAQRESVFKKSPKQQKYAKVSIASRPDAEKNGSRISNTPSPPPAPVAIKRRRVVGLVDELEEEEEEPRKRGPVRKLGDDFERVAKESGMKTGGAVAARTRGKKNDGNVGVEEGKVTTGNRKLVKGGRKIGASIVSAAAGIRSSPRLAKRGAAT
ncbi:UNVERIFIED_CONTAM: hypothetical protein Scaly_1193900 [Sesamum calycinum]|uniref:Uncharacterized protein n=1 Tax=Sesamum calycinum TaxID=2727403 RepID=A0AAW2Q3X9_9LAMI